MSDGLTSVGVDVGTTTTQLIVSRLWVQNQAGAFAVPEMVITDRDIVYQSPVYFTPLLAENLVDGGAIREIVAEEYRKAGLRREDVDTGAIIITGETSRKENARAVLEALSEFAGDFVVATAGPDLESVLAAKGAGAVAFSEQTGKRVLHMDIGGGTSNLALIEDGKILETGCLNVGGRLLKFDRNGKVTYVSPVLNGICQLKIGDQATEAQVEPVARTLVQALEMVAGLREKTQLLEKLTTEETRISAGSKAARQFSRAMRPYSEIAEPEHRDSNVVISFSGGVADCIENRRNPLEFGDMGPILGQKIRESLLCRGEYRLGDQTIRATVIGAGCHSAQLSGSTVFHKNVAFPLKNRPVVRLSEREQESAELAARIRRLLETQDTDAVLSLPGFLAPGYDRVVALAEEIVRGFGTRPVLIAMEQDMAKALGQAVALRLEPGQACLCIDRVRLTEGSYLDVAAPVGPAMPVVVKTLILAK
ncbi:MAG: ethanolamine ammonia-lyase reactivating factor EutA [Oscillospiraceae bacterium]|nr:ethanolamine ammonia-lyase reactivating factor EutA [Oscillospiraceae bacterium]